MPGAQCTRSLVRAIGSKYAHEYSQRRHRIHPAFPTQWFSRLIRDLPGDEFLLPPSSHGLNGFTCPVGPTKPPRDLASATDARTTRLRRTHQCRSSRSRRSLTKLESPPCNHLACTTSSRPPHPALHVRDDRDTPLFGRGGMARKKPQIAEKQKRFIFRERARQEFA